MRTIVATLIVLGLMLIGFALGRSPETSNAVLRALKFGKKVAERTAVHVEGKMHRGLGRLVERRLSDEHGADILGSSYRSIDRTYLKLRRCLEADHPCPGFNHGSLRDYREDVIDHAVNELGGHYEFLKNRPWDIQLEDEQLARVLLEDGHESIQMVGLKIIALFPVTETNLKLVAARLSVTLDDDLFREGVDYFYRNRSNAMVAEEAVKVFARQIHYSPSDSTAAVAAGAAFDFMNESNIRSFKDLRAALEPFPFRFNAVDSSIREFERRKRVWPR